MGRFNEAEKQEFVLCGSSYCRMVEKEQESVSERLAGSDEQIRGGVEFMSRCYHRFPMGDLLRPRRAPGQIGHKRSFLKKFGPFFHNILTPFES